MEFEDIGVDGQDPQGRDHGVWHANGVGIAGRHGNLNGHQVNGIAVTGTDAPARDDVPAGADAGPPERETQVLGEVAESITALGSDFPHLTASSRGPARWARALIGMDERLLDRVWEERARYTGLGAIVFGTAVMATLSMLDALDQVFGPVWPVLLLVALFWGTFICGIDRWLIASTHGMRSSRWRIFVPRIVLALIFGVIIATPLVLTVFGSEVVSQAQNDQNNALLAYESQLKACNPLPGNSGQIPAEPAGCAAYRVSVSDPAIGTDMTIAHEKAERAQLSSTISTDRSTIAKDNLVAREECNGSRGAGLSGIVGQGPNCNRDRQQADSFASQSHVAQLDAQLSDLNQRIASQTVSAGQQTQAYATATTNAIAALVATKKADEGRIGLLNRIDALGELAAKSAVIAGATVLLGLFIITVDCLPVLSKMMSGTTRYDYLVDARLKTAETIGGAGMKVSERRATGKYEIALQAIESEIRARLEKIDERSRMDKAKRDAELDRQIAELAAEFRRLAAERDGAGHGQGAET